MKRSGIRRIFIRNCEINSNDKRNFTSSFNILKQMGKEKTPTEWKRSQKSTTRKEKQEET
jgi:hypothetical protein